MATYPSYGISLESQRVPESGIEDDFSQPGTQHSRTLHSQQYYRFRVIHNLTVTELATLEAFYDAGPRTAHTFTYREYSPQQTYTVKFLAPPEVVRNQGGNRVQVEVNLRGYKN